MFFQWMFIVGVSAVFFWLKTDGLDGAFWLKLLFVAL